MNARQSAKRYKKLYNNLLNTPAPVRIKEPFPVMTYKSVKQLPEYIYDNRMLSVLKDEMIYQNADILMQNALWEVKPSSIDSYHDELCMTVKILNISKDEDA